MKITGILKRVFVDLFVLVFVFFLWTSSLVAPVFAVEAAPSDGGDTPNNKTFTITAYYSPLPCQNKYTTGSYDGDKRLNGNGVAGADGTGVFPGMVAAPSVYAFGTKMNIPGVGTVSVHDRGGAIVASNSAAGTYDRLDIWMGYGDIGLQRALSWGRRTVDVTVYGNDQSVKELITLSPAYTASESVPNCDNEPAEPIEPEVVVPQPEVAIPETKDSPPAVIEEQGVDGFNEVLNPGDSSEEVKQLQEELVSLHFLKIQPNGVYDEVTRHAVFKFQQSQSLVGDLNSPGAGVFGVKTMSKINSILSSRHQTSKLIASANTVDEMAFRDGFKLARELDFGVSGFEVKYLQRFLQEKGYFDYGALTSYFGPVTRDALIAFQLDYGIISDPSDLGAGRVGQATLAAINDLI